MRIASKEAEAARKARHAHVVAMLNKTVAMKAKPATRAMMAKAAVAAAAAADNADSTQGDDSSSESSDDEEAVAAHDALVVELCDVDLLAEFDESAHNAYSARMADKKDKKAAVKPTARIQVFRAAAAPPPPQHVCIIDIKEEEETTDATDEPNSFLQLFAELKSDVSDKFRDRFGFYLHRNLMADLQEIDCLQDMAKIAQAEITRIGQKYSDVVFAVTHDLLVLRGLDVHTAASIASRVFINFHLL